MPRGLSSWQHRFDDPRREYRTLYCADRRITCLREVLADLRPSTEALQDFARLFGDRRAIPAGVVSAEWRQAHVLAPAMIAGADGALVDLDDLAVRRRLERRHAALLAAHAMPHLDISQVRSRDRVVTQTISRALFEEGAAGIRFRSNLDDGPCAALFEGRAWLEPRDKPTPLTEDVEELLQVCEEYGLVLRH